MKRHWAINGRFLSQPVTGVQRYAREITRALDSLLANRPGLAEELELELLVPPNISELLDLQVIKTRKIGRAGGHIWEQFVLPANVDGGLLSLCNTGPIAIKKHIVCIHDLNTRRYPDSYSMAFRALYRVLPPAIGRSAAAVATVSRYSAQLIEDYRLAPSSRVFIAPNGHEHALRWIPRHSQITADIASADTIVLLGSRAPHKNIGLLTGLAHKLSAIGLMLAVVGGSDPRIFNGGQAEQLADNIFWLGRLSDNELAALLQDSMCLAFPSLEEGFGLPLLEAMTIGCPVVSSDRASMPEICGDAALYASPENPEAWLECFARLKNERDLRRKLKVKGSIQAARFSWFTSAELYLAAMANCDDSDATESEASVSTAAI